MKRTTADPSRCHELNVAAYSEGDECFKAGRYREALKLFKAAVSADPTDGDAWHAIGGCYDALGKPSKAAAAYRTAIPLLPVERHPDLHFNIGNAYFDLGQYSDAVAAYELVPSTSSAWPVAARNRGLALQRAGKHG